MSSDPTTCGHGVLIDGDDRCPDCGAPVIYRPTKALTVERLARALARTLNPYLDWHPLPVRPASHRQWHKLAGEVLAALRDKP